MKTHYDPSLNLDANIWSELGGRIPLHEVPKSSYGNTDSTNHVANVDCKICLKAMTKLTDDAREKLMVR